MFKNCLHKFQLNIEVNITILMHFFAFIKQTQLSMVDVIFGITKQNILFTYYYIIAQNYSEFMQTSLPYKQ